MKKILALILVFCCIFSLPIFPVFALQNIGDTEYDITTSDVMDDLSRTYIAGKKFDADEYPLTASADYMLLLNIIEYGWDEDNRSSYGLYFYLYNPSGDKPFTRGAHQVQMSVSKNDFYVKYFLKLVSASDDNRFLKFELNTPSAVYNRLFSDERTYKISGIEIETKAKGVKDYKIAGTYTFTGKQSSRTLSCKTDVLSTINLDLGSTFYRLDTSDLGDHYKTQLDTVYFTLDNSLMKNYGEVYSIQGQYQPRPVNGIVVYDRDCKLLERYASSNYYIMLEDYFDDRVRFTAVDDGVISSGHNEISFSSERSFWNNTFSLILTAFSRDKSDPNVKGEDILDFLNSYDPGKKCRDFINVCSSVGKYNSSYFLASDYLSGDRPLPFDISIEDTFDLESYKTNHNWIQGLLEYGLFNGYLKSDDGEYDVCPIEAVDPDDFDLVRSEFSDKYLVDESDVSSIKSAVKAAADNDQTLYLFRFESQDYYAVNITGGLTPYDYSESDPEWTSYDGYYFQEYIYENFDIMSITFRDALDRLTILPVVSDPIDIAGDSQPDRDPGDDDPPPVDWKKIIAIVMIVLVVLLVIWLIDKVIPKRVRLASSSGRRRRR